MAEGNDRDRSWKEEVLRLIRSHWLSDQVFSLSDIYAFVDQLTQRHPENLHVEAKVRQVLQQLRDEGEITFVDNGGHYAPNRLVLQPGDLVSGVSDPMVRAQLLRIRNLLGQVVASSELQ